MKKIFVVFIMVIFLGVTGCSLDREAYLVRAGGPNFNHGSTYIIESREELDEYIKGTYNNFESSVEKYDDSFFENSSIVIAEIVKNTGSAKIKLKSVKIDDGSMIIKFNTKTPNIVTMDMAYWHIIVVCSKEESKQISNIELYDSGNKVIEKTV